MVGRIPVMDVMPVVDLGRQPAKATVGEPFPVSASVFREGHDKLGAEVVLTGPDGVRRDPVRMTKAGDVPDPEHNDKFAHKLEFLAALTRWSEALDTGKRIMVGDFNIAPYEHDVWSHKALLNVISHTPIETEGLLKLLDTGWVDAVRKFVPTTEKLYTWWSYRNRTWPGDNRGRRLDHIWVTPQLSRKVEGTFVLREARGWPQASDHVPVAVDIEI